nr:probable inactive purple acid phosphatase 27 isoform X1 [Ipomoea batatas]
MKKLFFFFFCSFIGFGSALHSHISVGKNGHILGEQPLSKIAIHKAVLALRDSASIQAKPDLLGLKGEDTEWVAVNLQNSQPSNDDWVAVFSPAKFK